MFTKILFLLRYFIVSSLCVLILSFGLSFLIVPHQSVDAYELMQEAILSGQRITADWWNETYIPEKHQVRFALLAEKRAIAFKILFLVLLPLVFWSFLRLRSSRTFSFVCTHRSDTC